MTIDILDQFWLAAALIDCEDRDIVLAAVEDLLALDVDLALVALGDIDEAAVGMDVDRARALRRLFVAGIGQGVLDEYRLTAEPAGRLELVDIELVLPLDRHVDPGLGRVKIEMPRPEAEPVPGRDRGEVRQRAVLEYVELERTRIFRFGAGGIVAAA